MNFRQTGFTAVEERDGHKDGWTQSFDRLAAYLKRLSGSTLSAS
jgi:uncharacterized protein YndB with AHSA1/START domain